MLHLVSLQTTADSISKFSLITVVGSQSCLGIYDIGTLFCYILLCRGAEVANMEDMESEPCLPLEPMVNDVQIEGQVTTDK